MAAINLLVSDAINSLQGQKEYSVDFHNTMTNLRANKDFIKERNREVTRAFYQHFYTGSMSIDNLRQQQRTLFQENAIASIMKGGIEIIQDPLYNQKAKKSLLAQNIRIKQNSNQSTPQQTRASSGSEEMDTFDLDIIHKNTSSSLFKIISSRYIKTGTLWEK